MTEAITGGLYKYGTKLLGSLTIETFHSVNMLVTLDKKSGDH